MNTEPIVMPNEGHGRTEYCPRWNWENGSVSYGPMFSDRSVVQAFLDKLPAGVTHGEMVERTIATTPWEPVDDAPETEIRSFGIGISTSSDPLHAVRARRLNGPRDWAPTVCGTKSTVASQWGEFVRGNEYVDRHALCPQCAWFVALEHGTADDELARRRPRGAYAAALGRCLPDPLLYIRTAERLLELAADAETEHDTIAAFLGHITKHKPTLLMGEDCTDYCEHDSEDECYGDKPTVVCLECSVLNGSWAGEWEGQVHIAVPPCGVLPAVAAHYDVKAVAL